MKTLNDSNAGYISNVEILGNTIQDPNTLDIYGISEKIEGSESVKLKLTSCNKNIFKPFFFKPSSAATLKFENIGERIFVSGYTVDDGTNTDYGLFNDGNNLEYTKFINSLPPGTTMSVSNNLGLYSYFGYHESGAKKYIQDKLTTTQNTSNIECFIRFRGDRTYTGEEFKMQIELSQPSEYIRYEEDVKEIILPCDLNGINDIKDRLYYNGEEWVIEKWILSGKIDDNNFEMRISKGTNTDGLVIEPRANIKNSIPRNSKFYIEGFLEGSYNNSWENTEMIGRWYRNPLNLVLVLPVGETLENAASKVLGKTFYTHLTEPKIIKTGLTDPNLLSLKTYNDITHIIFNNKNIDGSMKFKYGKNFFANTEIVSEAINETDKNIENIKKIDPTEKVDSYEFNTSFNRIENTTNGYIDNVKIKGKSLVNLWNINMISPKSSITNNRVKIKTDGINMYENFFLTKSGAIKPNTTYTIVAHIYKNTYDAQSTIWLTNNSGPAALDVFLAGSPWSNTFSIPGGQTGTLCRALTTSNDIDTAVADMRSFAKNPSLTAGYELELQIVLLEGDYTNEPPEYFKYFLSSGEDNEIEVYTCGKNLFPYPNINIPTPTEINWFDALGNSAMDGTNILNSNTYFYLPRGYIKFDVDSIDNCILQIITKEKKLIGYNYNYFDGGYVMVRLKPLSTNKPFGITNGRITWVDTVTSMMTKQPHTDYSHNKKNLFLPNLVNSTDNFERVILRGINNDIYDSIEKNPYTNRYKYIKRCGQVIIDGTKENIDLPINFQPINQDFARFNITLSEAADGLALNDNQMICNNFKYVYIHSLSGGGSIAVNCECVCTHGLNYEQINLIIRKDRLTAVTVNGLKQWLLAKPLELIYKLRTPVEIELPYDLDMRTYDTRTYMQISNTQATPSMSFDIKSGIENTLVSIMNKREINMNIIDNIYNLIPLMSQNAITPELDAIRERIIVALNEHNRI